MLCTVQARDKRTKNALQQRTLSIPVGSKGIDFRMKQQHHEVRYLLLCLSDPLARVHSSIITDENVFLLFLLYLLHAIVNKMCEIVFFLPTQKSQNC